MYVFVSAEWVWILMIAHSTVAFDWGSLTVKGSYSHHSATVARGFAQLNVGLPHVYVC